MTSTREYNKQYWAKNRGRIRAQRVARLIKIKELFGSKCTICGYEKNYAALVFHHPDDSKKEKEIAKYTSLESMKKEAAKCILMCSNCHMELHNREYEKHYNST